MYIQLYLFLSRRDEFYLWYDRVAATQISVEYSACAIQVPSENSSFMITGMVFGDPVFQRHRPPTEKLSKIRYAGRAKDTRARMAEIQGGDPKELRERQQNT